MLQAVGPTKAVCISFLYIFLHPRARLCLRIQPYFSPCAHARIIKWAGKIRLVYVYM